jgi:hypothetical protein
MDNASSVAMGAESSGPGGMEEGAGNGGDDENMGGPIDPVDALYLMRNAPGFDSRGDPIFDDPELEDLLFNLAPPPKNASPPKIGQALADELAQLPQTERESLMARLRDEP